MSLQHVLTQLGAPTPLAATLAAVAAKYNIVTPLHQAHWVGQMMQETNNFRHFKESLNYGVNGLLTTFSRSRISRPDAVRYGRIDENERRKLGIDLPDQPANQPMLGQLLYGGQWGARNLGNRLSHPKDGYAFIGRGCAHLTGFSAYHAYSLAVHGDLRCVDHPELLERIPDMAECAGWFWQSKPGISTAAGRDDVPQVTKLWNGGDHGLDNRILFTKRAKRLLGV